MRVFATCVVIAGVLLGCGGSPADDQTSQDPPPEPNEPNEKVIVPVPTELHTNGAHYTCGQYYVKGTCVGILCCATGGDVGCISIPGAGC